MEGVSPMSIHGLLAPLFAAAVLLCGASVVLTLIVLVTGRDLYWRVSSLAAG
jgi:hypothetical protein